MPTAFHLTDRIALITGGGSGLGRAIAQAFLKAGAARVYIVSRKADVLERAAAELDQDGRCIALPADLSSVDGCRDLAKRFREREERLDILVHNSGVSWLASFDDYPEKGWDRTFQVNLKAPFFLTQALKPYLVNGASKDAHASVIAIGSIAGEMDKATDSFAYGLSKGALHHVIRMLAIELGPDNITVNAIAPGRFETNMTEGIVEDQERYEREASFIPLRRWGVPAQLGGTAVYLASAAGSYVTGATIVVDGGLSLEHPISLGRE